MSWPPFDVPVPNGGYRWWYVDGLSDDGLHGITVIAFIGSVFSPYYASSRRLSLDASDPLDHCAINVALYGKGARTGRSWAMTERGRNAVERSETRLAIGPSRLTRDINALVIEIDEVTVPFPSRLRGTVRLEPQAISALTIPLDSDSRHWWTPIAPCSRIHVAMESPALEWTGNGYFDGNGGDAPVEHAFHNWHWSRGSLRDGNTAVTYDVNRRDGSHKSIALRFAADGPVSALDAPPPQNLPNSTWRIARKARADGGHKTRIAATLEDAPFYSRSLVHSMFHGHTMTSIHESLDLNRFQRRWVQALLSLRMPRR